MDSSGLRRPINHLFEFVAEHKRPNLPIYLFLASYLAVATATVRLAGVEKQLPTPADVRDSGASTCQDPLHIMQRNASNMFLKVAISVRT